MANTKNKINEPRINDEIRGVETVRIVGDNIESREISLKEAKRIASNLELDLVEINGNVNPPIVKVVDYSKYMFELKKALKNKNKKNCVLKEIQLSTNISSNDLNTKVRKAKEFIEDGNKVKVVLTMKGRELGRREDSKKSLLTFIVEMDEVAVPESLPRDEGNKCTVILKKK